LECGAGCVGGKGEARGGGSGGGDGARVWRYMNTMVYNMVKLQLPTERWP